MEQYRSLYEQMLEKLNPTIRQLREKQMAAALTGRDYKKIALELPEEEDDDGTRGGQSLHSVRTGNDPQSPVLPEFDPQHEGDFTFAINTYLAALQTYKKYPQAIQVVHDMPRSIDTTISPSAHTYSYAFSMIIAWTRDTFQKDPEAKPPMKDDETSQARSLWDRLAEQHKACVIMGESKISPLDSKNAIEAIRALSYGTKEDRQLAYDLVEPLFGIPAISKGPSSAPKDLKLPTFEPKPITAESIMNMCLRHKNINLAKYYASYFRSRPEVGMDTTGRLQDYFDQVLNPLRPSKSGQAATQSSRGGQPSSFKSEQPKPSNQRKPTENRQRVEWKPTMAPQLSKLSRRPKKKRDSWE